VQLDPKIYSLAPSCFDTAVTTNLDLIRKTYPTLGIREDAKVMYIVEFDDLEVQADPRDPARRIGRVSIMEKQAAAELIQRQVDALQNCWPRTIPRPPSALTWPATRPGRMHSGWDGEARCRS